MTCCLITPNFEFATMPFENSGDQTAPTDDTVDTEASQSRRSHHQVRLMLDEENHSRHHKGNNDGNIAPQSTFRRYTGRGGLWSSMLPDFQWVPQNTTWSKWKPVIRCALAAWICGLLFIISKTENAMGQVSLFSDRESETYNGSV
jgi:hypothetical protein